MGTHTHTPTHTHTHAHAYTHQQHKKQKNNTVNIKSFLLFTLDQSQPMFQEFNRLSSIHISLLLIAWNKMFFNQSFPKTASFSECKSNSLSVTNRNGISLQCNVGYL